MPISQSAIKASASAFYNNLFIEVRVFLVYLWVLADSFRSLKASFLTCEFMHIPCGGDGVILLHFSCANEPLPKRIWLKWKETLKEGLDHGSEVRVRRLTHQKTHENVHTFAAARQVTKCVGAELCKLCKLPRWLPSVLREIDQAYLPENQENQARADQPMNLRFDDSLTCNGQPGTDTRHPAGLV